MKSRIMRAQLLAQLDWEARPRRLDRRGDRPAAKRGSSPGCSSHLANPRARRIARWDILEFSRNQSTFSVSLKAHWPKRIAAKARGRTGNRRVRHTSRT
jgi:hypothetical protein